jgi:hypothetical protein
MLFMAKKFLGNMVHCRDEAARSFVAKVQGKVFKYFHAVGIKHHSST